MKAVAILKTVEKIVILAVAGILAAIVLYNVTTPLRASINKRQVLAVLREEMADNSGDTEDYQSIGFYHIRCNISTVIIFYKPYSFRLTNWGVLYQV